MTDAPGEIPEREQPEQPGGLEPSTPAAYPYQGQPVAGHVPVADDEEAEEEDLLMPGSAAAWGESAAAQPVPPAPLPRQNVRPVAGPGPHPTEPEYLDVPMTRADEPSAADAVPAEPAAEPVAEPVAEAAPEAAQRPVAEEPVASEEPVEPVPAVEPAAPEPEAVAVREVPAAEGEATSAPVRPEPAAARPGTAEPAPAPQTPAEEAPAESAPVEEAPAAPSATEPEPAVASAVAAPESVEVPAEQADVAEPAPEPEPVEASGDAPAAPVPAQPVPAEAETVVVTAPPRNQPAEQDGTAEPAGTDERPAGGYPESERDAVHRLMRDRRDVHHGFRQDPVPPEVLLRVLEAAHSAPSVGPAQPWDFVLIKSAETRATIHELARRQRDSYAKSLSRARARQYRQLSVDAIRDTPVNIVVTADPTRGGRNTYGWHPQPQTTPYSSALAVENLWLAARAEGLGVGWIGFFDERELVHTLGLPEHLEVVAYLCVGYVDTFPEEAEQGQGGWTHRRPLSWVVHEESYGRRALPGAEPHDLLSETLAEIRPLDAQALGEAWERQKRMTKPAGSLGALEVISAQLCGLSRSCPPPVPEPAALAIFAADHGVHAQGVTPWPQEVTGQMVANFLGGGAVCNAFAAQVGAEVCVIDVGVRDELPTMQGLIPRRVRPGTNDLSIGPAMTRDEALRAVEIGIEIARDLVSAGNLALLTGEMGVANTTPAAALVAAFTGAEAAEVTGRGSGVDDETHARKVDVVRRALQLHQPDPGDPLGVLAAVGGLEHAALAGLILGGAAQRVPVLLDGVSAGAAALAARAIAPEAVSVCVAGHRSSEPGHQAALTALGLRPMIDLDLRLGEGSGALLALPVVQSVARAMRQVATFDSAGVTDKN
ncbi:nicotinate-nucleotide-dimethylbenzimidazole phosphoribosyltransferase /cob(II)yrinic acid a,c-diamide reductase [Streptomyces zhaozhouensis]|uniref:Nicotinate-nucleotide--dimethylbenzimidazole phosphoribosyltransferase n=1 Tax=Streptomyces zhaozhouensis TaxID=1300267 RepID=A0A286DRY3_9ACTN|nr:nicotinate-nucleotide--dimethylbenzimidazole phosphoribosyltransferase [Streptomyces zhaozhouensis]SOD61373.1 nicotinate-nucleotide-dimethylbenzimidazole phosphoribosyltransferase /cob(II)yrinic acid a,c-diamide reductase [Streptomyces zhaozhouensis]